MSAKRDSHFREKEFLERLVSKDSAAIEEVVKAYTEHLYKAGLGMGFPLDQAEEVAHNTWTTFFEILHKFEGRSHIRTFLFGIFYHKCSELRRANSKFEKSDPIEEVMESKFETNGHWKPETGNPHRALEDQEMMGLLEKCLEHLPVQQRAAFMLKIVQEEETEEICETLGVSNTNLRQLLFRGKNRLKECINASIK